MSDTSSGFRLARPDELPERLAQTQIALAEAINLNLLMLSLILETVPAARGGGFGDLVERGIKLAERVARLAQGKSFDA